MGWCKTYEDNKKIVLECDVCSNPEHTIVKMKCETCEKTLTENEEIDSERFIGGDRYFCNEHLNEKMGW